jgi:hypothetical protein
MQANLCKYAPRPACCYSVIVTGTVTRGRDLYFSAEIREGDVGAGLVELHGCPVLQDHDSCHVCMYTYCVYVCMFAC